MGVGSLLGRDDSHPGKSSRAWGRDWLFHLHGNPDKPTTQLGRVLGGGWSNPGFGSQGREVVASAWTLTCAWKSPGRAQASPARSTRASDNTPLSHPTSGPAISCPPFPAPAATPGTVTPQPPQPRVAPWVPAATIQPLAPGGSGPATGRPPVFRPPRDGRPPLAASLETGWIGDGPTWPQEAEGLSWRPPAQHGAPAARAATNRRCWWCAGTETDSTRGWPGAGVVGDQGGLEGVPLRLRVPAVLQHPGLPGAPAQAQSWLPHPPASSAHPCSLTHSRSSNCSGAWKRNSWPMPAPWRLLPAIPPWDLPLILQLRTPLTAHPAPHLHHSVSWVANVANPGSLAAQPMGCLGPAAKLCPALPMRAAPALL